MTETRSQRMRRARPVLAIASVAFVLGAVVGANHSDSSATATAGEFVGAWAHRDYPTMYSDIDTAAQHETPIASFVEDYEQALSTATVADVKVAGKPHALPQGEIAVPVHVYTRLFGELRLNFMLKVSEDSSGSERVQWSRTLVFPGLRPGEQLSSSTTLPQRATLLARDGSVLAESPADTAPTASAGEETRNSPLGSAADAVLGTVGPIPRSLLQSLEAQGVPSDAQVGLSGLERALDGSLRGRAGGELLAGQRLLAYTTPHAASAVRTSVSPGLQRTAVEALGGQLGGVIAMVPSTGEILAVAGLGLDGLQPPGSTFKMVTVTGVLSAHIANRKTVFPYATHATLDGVKLENANGEECGGTLELAFAQSCNSVFTPLGVKLGAQKLVSTAELFGFNHPPSIAGAAESTLPGAGSLQGELDIGSTAIGQGEVLATPLEMATVAATVAENGRRPNPTFLADSPQQKGSPVMSSSVAHTVRRLMEAVVRYGTGTSAAIPGVTVAGKTGTAELKAKCTPASSAPSPSTETSTTSTTPTETCQPGETEASNTDAWFAAFAPALNPRIVVCVLLVKDGAGGTTAAPVARQVIEAALQNGL